MTAHRLRLAALGVAVFAAVVPPAHARVPERPWLDQGNESVAATDDALALLVNPAAIGLRYPSEFQAERGWLPGDRALWQGLLTTGGFGVLARRHEDDAQDWGFGLGGGDDACRLGWTSTWRRDLPTDTRAHDVTLGLRSSPRPWLALGGTVNHLFQPHLAGGVLGRDWSAGVGVRPLALVPRLAHDAGTRLTLTADVVLAERGTLEEARTRIGAELEPIRGIVLRGSLEDHGVAHVGLTLRGRQASLHGHAARRDGDRAGESVALSFHEGEERAAFASRAERRVAEVRVGGHLGDEGLSGLSLFGYDSDTPVKPIHDQLERALEDPLTRGVLIELRGVSNMAQIEELRPRIARLRNAGKPVVAYAPHGLGRGDLYLGGACDLLVVGEEAEIGGLGLPAERRFYRKLLADWGVRIDRTAYGKYKSAYRNFSADSTPPADRESIQRSLDVRQELFVSTFAADRHLDRARLMPFLDGRPWRAASLRQAGVIDSTGYREDALRMLGRLCDLGDRPRTANLGRAPQARRVWTLREPVAVVYASGGISTGASGNDLLFGAAMGSETVTRQIERAFERRGVRAVVLRVESPGGSTVASDLIHHATERMKERTKKPLVVSMGESAASGGYYISAHGDRLYADRFTATGSIGVVQIKPSLEGWYRKHDVRQEDFSRGRFMRGWSLGHDWTAEEQAIADSMTFAYYRAFVAHVADGRRMSWDAVHAVAQGRVWYGEDAQRRGLVDRIGGLEDAMAEARRLAGVPEGEVIRPVEFRRPRPGLVQRALGAAVAEAWDRSMKLPETDLLFWADDEALP